MKRILIPSLVIIAMYAILIILILQVPQRISLKPQMTQKQWSDEDELAYANILLAKGLNSQAASAFKNYIDKSDADRKELAKLCYRLGNIYMGLYEYEKALSAFYKAEMLDSQADFRSQMNQKIVQALENLGMSSQAQYELEARTTLGRAAKKEGRVVARIGKDKITETQINKAMDRLPDWMRKNLQTKEGRQNFIREYVAREVLYRKAKRLGLDKTAKIRENIEALKKQLIVQQLLQKEIDEKLRISPEDLELYYKANKDKYIEPEAIRISYVELKDESKKEEGLCLLKEKKGKKINQWIQKGQTYIQGIGEAENVITGLFLKEKGDFTDPIKIKDKFYIFSIDEKRAQRQKDFNEVKGRVEYEYRLMKQKELTSSLLESALEEQEVEIYYEPLKKNDENKE